MGFLGRGEFSLGRVPAAKRWRHPTGARLVDGLVQGGESDIYHPGLHEMVRVSRGRNALRPLGRAMGCWGAWRLPDWWCRGQTLRVMNRRYDLMVQNSSMLLCTTDRGDATGARQRAPLPRCAVLQHTSCLPLRAFLLSSI